MCSSGEDSMLSVRHFLLFVIVVQLANGDVLVTRTTTQLTDEKLLRMLLMNNTSLTRSVIVEEKSARPYIYRWSDGRRESGMYAWQLKR